MGGATAAKAVDAANNTSCFAHHLSHAIGILVLAPFLPQTYEQLVLPPLGGARERRVSGLLQGGQQRLRRPHPGMAGEGKRSSLAV